MFEVRRLMLGVSAAISINAGTAHAATLVEQFNDPFPDWESGWLATNSNIQNYYGVGADRGNQPNGLWVEDDTPFDSAINVVFDNAFAATLTSFSLDVATFIGANILSIYDASGATVATFLGFDTASFDVAVNFSVISSNGIGGFSFSNSSSSGNTWIDNVSVSNGALAPVPLPAAGFLLVGALGGFAFLRRRKTCGV